ncbi:MAG: hypothetical protein IIU65_00645 [Clostridia bacterium]|nr:hypothetical protein [Clostridia bacterium]
MKKKIIISICLVFCLIGVIIWWNVPAKKIDVDYDNIEKIVVTDLATGEEFIAIDKDDKMGIIAPFSEEHINFKKVGFSSDNSDKCYQVKIELKDESLGGLNGWNEFTVYSDNRVKKGQFYYTQYDADFSVYQRLKYDIEKLED